MSGHRFSNRVSRQRRTTDTHGHRLGQDKAQAGFEGSQEARALDQEVAITSPPSSVRLVSTRSKQENHARQKKNLFHGRDRRSVTFGPLEWQGDVAATSAAARSERKARKALLRAPNVQTTVSACLKKRFVLATSIESQIDYVVVSRQLHS